MSMRTTITLDDDVATMLRSIHEKERKPFKQVVNEVLRLGIMEKRPGPERPAHYETPSLHTGPCRYPNLDSVADILAAAEKEDYS
ncbi:MAG: DUF2191 domain-containing protein [Bacteroidetes bacterium]|nr:DUF2191 domain-containing protein [Bacteroidota bacterium]